jgi:hypothetical protein
VPAAKELDQLAVYWSDGHIPGGIDGHAIASHFQREDLIWNLLQFDNRTVERR